MKNLFFSLTPNLAIREAEKSTIFYLLYSPNSILKCKTKEAPPTVLNVIFCHKYLPAKNKK